MTEPRDFGAKPDLRIPLLSPTSQMLKRLSFVLGGEELGEALGEVGAGQRLVPAPRPPPTPLQCLCTE